MIMSSIKLFTIGYTKRTAEVFFEALKQAEIKLLIDVRLNNTSQLAGYTKKDDFPFFLREICNISYRHIPELAPTSDILDDYKAKVIDWQTYELKFRQLLGDRNLIPLIESLNLDHSCLLCASRQMPSKISRGIFKET